MALGFRNGVMYDFFKSRRPGTLIPEAADGNKRAAGVGFKWLNAQMSDGRNFLAGDRLSLADLRLYIVYSFYSKHDPSMQVDPGLQYIAAWQRRMESVSGVKAMAASKPRL